MWVKDNPQLVKQIKDFVYQYEKTPSLIASFFQSEAFEFFHRQNSQSLSTNQSSCLILIGALNQEYPLEKIIGFVEKLLVHFSTRLFIVPVISHEELQAFIQKEELIEFWKLKPQVPGIIWSVAQFVNKYSLEKIISQTERFQVIQILTQNVFYMGKHSEIKAKANFIYNHAVTDFPYSIGLMKQSFNEYGKLVFPTTRKAGDFMYTMGPLYRSGKKFPNEKERERFFNKFYREMMGNKAYLLAHAIEFYDKKLHKV